MYQSQYSSGKEERKNTCWINPIDISATYMPGIYKTSRRREQKQISVPYGVPYYRLQQIKQKFHDEILVVPMRHHTLFCCYCVVTSRKIWIRKRPSSLNLDQLSLKELGVVGAQEEVSGSWVGEVLFSSDAWNGFDCCYFWSTWNVREPVGWRCLLYCGDLERGADLLAKVPGWVWAWSKWSCVSVAVVRSSLLWSHAPWE